MQLIKKPIIDEIDFTLHNLATETREILRRARAPASLQNLGATLFHSLAQNRYGARCDLWRAIRFAICGLKVDRRDFDKDRLLPTGENLLQQEIDAIDQLLGSHGHELTAVQRAALAGFRRDYTAQLAAFKKSI